MRSCSRGCAQDARGVWRAGWRLRRGLQRGPQIAVHAPTRYVPSPERGCVDAREPRRRRLIASTERLQCSSPSALGKAPPPRAARIASCRGDPRGTRCPPARYRHGASFAGTIVRLACAAPANDERPPRFMRTSSISAYGIASHPGHAERREIQRSCRRRTPAPAIPTTSELEEEEQAKVKTRENECGHRHGAPAVLAAWSPPAASLANAGEADLYARCVAQ